MTYVKKGFSLVELLIVLVIFAALIAIVTPIALNALSKAKATQIAENIIQIRNSSLEYILLNDEISEDTYLKDLVRGSIDDYILYYYIENGVLQEYIQYDKNDFNIDQIHNLLLDANYLEETINFYPLYQNGINVHKMTYKENTGNIIGSVPGLDKPSKKEFVFLTYPFTYRLY